MWDLFDRAEQAAAARRAAAVSVTLEGPLASLLDLQDSPSAVFVRGNIDALGGPCVAIVGSRDADDYSLAAARTLARSLGRAGLCIVSGGALGVDAAAHEGALDVGASTVAVLASSVDQPGPARNRQLFERLLKSDGALLSECPAGERPARHAFVLRNRVIAALARAVVVVAASESSGALHTARFALALKRGLFAVPGDLSASVSSGSNGLIAAGQARCLTHPDQVARAAGAPRLANPWPEAGVRRGALPLAWRAAGAKGAGGTEQFDVEPPDDPLALAVGEKLGNTPRDVQSLSNDTGLSASEVLRALGSLELAGCADRVAGLGWARAEGWR